MPKITRIVIKDYRSIRRLDVTPSRKGAIAKGRNAEGKTSFLKAITAALAARGVDPKDIRNGEDKSEIMLDIDALKVTRKITANTHQVTVTENGETWKRPQTKLTEMLGTAAVDPLEFFLAKAPERRKMVLDAIPVDVTFADVDRWTEGGAAALGLQPDYVVKGTGLDEVERLRKLFYDKRTDANRDAKEARGEADRASDAAAAADPCIGAPTVTKATADLEAARAALNTLKGKAAAATSSAEAGQKARDRVQALKIDRARLVSDRQPPSDVEQRLAADAVKHAQQAVASLEAQLADARQRLESASAIQREVVGRTDRAATIDAKLGEIDQQIATLEGTLADLNAVGATQEQIDQAAADVERAEREMKRAQSAQQAQALNDAAKVAKAKAREKEATAGHLDDIVKTLTSTATRELAQRADILPGLSFEGDEVLLDGIRVGELCGAEQMRFAVDLARRLNAKAKILVVDGLERLDDGNLREFIKMATADDFQLFATKVENGDLVVEAIEP